jgi:hypothetical protein
MSVLLVQNKDDEAMVEYVDQRKKVGRETTTSVASSSVKGRRLLIGKMTVQEGSSSESKNLVDRDGRHNKLCVEQIRKSRE